MTVGLVGCVMIATVATVTFSTGALVLLCGVYETCDKDEGQRTKDGKGLRFLHQLFVPKRESEFKFTCHLPFVIGH